MMIRINWFSFVVYAKILLCFYKKVNSALGKHRTKFLLKQMRQTGIKHWRVARKISWSQARNQLGTSGWAKSFL